eukprot:TRINITY_DN1179_c2_g1_i1.p1 TRINITY_DN1179_c2_g1~~TRINITY_DN1179_c2_g1_i1.p1  ORF type:complete len:199 (-),score=57.40 TRINITY_DN1179_c2_g1_i1:131-727(-)
MSKLYFSYELVHIICKDLSERILEFKPDIIIAIGGGGFIPSRILRSFIKVPIFCVSMKFYDDETNSTLSKPILLQWIDKLNYSEINQKRVLIIDEVDDTRTTLAACCEEIIERHTPEDIGVAVLVNKLKEKRKDLPTFNNKEIQYYSGLELEDLWIKFPWDADDIFQHTSISNEQFSEYIENYKNKNINENINDNNEN